jgi:hypothetical protein
VHVHVCVRNHVCVCVRGCWERLWEPIGAEG